MAITIGPAGDERVVAHLDPPLAVERPAAAEQLDAPLLEPRKLHRVVEVVDHLVAAGQRRLGVQLARHRLRGAGNASHLGEHLGRAQQRLRGHARVVGALAADQVVLDDGDLQPALGDSTGADLARGARLRSPRRRTRARPSVLLSVRLPLGAFQLLRLHVGDQLRASVPELAPPAGEGEGRQRRRRELRPQPARAPSPRRPGGGRAPESPAGARPASRTRPRPAPRAAVEGDPRTTLRTARARSAPPPDPSAGITLSSVSRVRLAEEHSTRAGPIRSRRRCSAISADARRPRGARGRS